MEILEAVRAAIKELVIPELDGLKSRLVEVQGRVEAQAEAIRTLNSHVVDQSRRIDTLREELSTRIDQTNARIDALREELTGRLDATNARIDALREELGMRIEGTNARLDATNARLDATNARIDALREELGMRIDATNQRIDRLYEVIVRREEHDQLARRLQALEQEVGRIKERLAMM